MAGQGSPGRRSIWTRPFWVLQSSVRTWLFAACGLVGFGGVSEAQAQDPALLQRLERLEQQNEELRQQIADRTTPINLEQDGSAQQVQKIVADYLKEVDKKKKADEDAKKKKDAEEGVEVGKQKDFKAVFNNGLHFSTSDGAFKAALNGRWQNDWGWVDQGDFFPDNERLDDGVIFRRARLGVQGTIWEQGIFSVDFEFASGSDIAWREVYMGVINLPVIGNFYAGHMKEPFSLEQETSSKHHTFIERNICDDAFVNNDLGFNPGFMISRNFFEERASIQTGLFRNAPDNPPTGLGDGNYNWTSRVTILPVWQQDGRCMVHLGAAYSYKAVPRADITDFADVPVPISRYRARPYRIDAEEFLDISLAGNEKHVFNLEAAAVRGPLSVQGEFYYSQQTDCFFVDGADVTGDPLGDVDFFGYYAFVSYFLTGEHRVYSRNCNAGPANPRFTRQFVYEPFFLVRRGEDGCGGCCCGKGAWEIAARIGYLNLNDDQFTPDNAPEAGQMWQYTLGVNWYWNPNMKVQWNYEHLFTDRREAGAPDGFLGVPTNKGGLDTFVMRFAWDF